MLNVVPTHRQQIAIHVEQFKTPDHSVFGVYREADTGSGSRQLKEAKVRFGLKNLHLVTIIQRRKSACDGWSA